MANGVASEAVFTTFASSVSVKYYSATGLTPGSMYQFKVKSRNLFGLSLTFSNTYSVLCAYVPTKPDTPTTLVIDNYVLIDWVRPFNGGKTITGYKIYIRQTENIYSINLVDCDGSTSSITSATQCQVPLSSLTSSPYSLSLGATVDVKVIAYNSYGDSEYSEVGSGATVALVPDMPIDLENDLDVTNDIRIGFNWADGPSSNGQATLDYTISFD
jgi:hypothetical protein